MPNDEAATAHGLELLPALREATHGAHEKLDAAFSSIDLAEKAGYARFLSAHLVGLAPVIASASGFAKAELGVGMPDYIEILRRDLAELNVDFSGLPALPAPQDISDAAACYVIAGSRLGIASIRKAPYWSAASGMASRYMEDSEGLAVWRALTAWMRNRTVSAQEADRHCQGAIACFDLFGQALCATQTQVA